MEQLKSLLNFGLEEYKAIRGEIISNLASQHQLITVSVAAISIMVAASPSLIETQAWGVFAAFSMGLSGLMWLQLRYARSNMALLDYIVGELAPRIRGWLGEMSLEKRSDLESVLAAERVIRETGYSTPSRWWDLPLEASRYLITLFASLASFWVYFTNRESSPSLTWLMVTGLQLIITGYTLYALVQARKTFLNRPIGIQAFARELASNAQVAVGEWSRRR